MVVGEQNLLRAPVSQTGVGFGLLKFCCGFDFSEESVGLGLLNFCTFLSCSGACGREMAADWDGHATCDPPGQGGPRWDGLASHARRLSQARPADGSLPPAVCTLQPAASTRAGRAHPITRTLGYPQNEEPLVAYVNGAGC